MLRNNEPGMFQVVGKPVCCVRGMCKKFCRIWILMSKRDKQLPFWQNTDEPFEGRVFHDLLKSGDISRPRHGVLQLVNNPLIKRA